MYPLTVTVHNNLYTFVYKGGSETPMTSRGRYNQTPLSTLPRDELGLNRMDMAGGDDISVSATSFATTITGRTKTIKEIAREERMALKQARKELEMALASLPLPQFEYELAVPDVVTEDEDHDGVNHSRAPEDDAIDIENEKRNQILLEAAKRLNMQSSVLKRKDLPRPFGVIERTIVEPIPTIPDDESSALRMILEEMYLLLEHDAFSNPCLAQNVATQVTRKDRDKKDKTKRRHNTQIVLPPMPSIPLEAFSEDDLRAAKTLVENETRSVSVDNLYCTASTTNVWFGKSTVEEVSVGEHVTALMDEFQSLKDASNFIRRKADKIEAKLNIKNQGYAKRSECMKQDILQRFAEFQHKKIEAGVFSMLSLHEQKGFEQRIKQLEDEIDVLRGSESSSQKRYGALVHEKNRHLARLRNQEKNKD